MAGYRAPGALVIRDSRGGVVRFCRRFLRARRVSRGLGVLHPPVPSVHFRLVYGSAWLYWGKK